MRTWHTTLAAGVLATLVAGAVPSQAQQVTVGNRFHTLSDSFFENNTIGFSGNYRGITFSVGDPGLSKPQFGSPDLTAGLSANFAIVGKYGQINFYTNFSQGYKQAMTTQAPSVTIMNGQTGYMSDTSQTPFVVSVVPVVGAFPVAPQPFQQVSADPSAIDPRIQAMMQAHANAQAQAAAQAAAQDQAGGPIPPLPQQQRPNNLAPQQNKKLAPRPMRPPPRPTRAMPPDSV